jgi:GDP-4-dehydro-6-deoxy-D-mannose reductase
MRVLVTGGAGFVGQWLIRALLARGDAVHSAGLHPHAPASERRVLTDDEVAAVHWLEVDIRRVQQLEAAVDSSVPDAVFHLAAVSFVPNAQRAPAEAFDINVVGFVRLAGVLAARRRAGVLDPVVLVVGSAEQYGRHEPRNLPLVEEAPQRPLTVYAASKAAQEVAALQTFRTDGLRVVATRSFNHSGPGQDPSFLLPALVRRGIAVRDGGSAALPIGNGDTVRDFLHVADVVEAYLTLAERGEAGEVYNVCSGEGASVRELAQHVLLRLGVRAEIVGDQSLMRPVDVPALVGSPAKLQRATGWRPTHARADIIDDLIHAATH